MKKGFTLIELLLSISVIAILLLGINTMLASVLEAREKSQTIREVESEGVFIAQLIAQTVRNAQGVSTPTLGTNETTLVLDVSDASKSPTTFDLSSGTLRIKEGAGAATPLSSSHVEVSLLKVDNLSRSGTPNTIQIQLTLSSVNPSNRNEYAYAKTFTTSASIR